MKRTSVLLFLATSSLAWTVAASAQEQAIDIRKSVMTVRVYKAGVFSAFGHDHEIAAPITGGSADIATHHVELRMDAGALRVRDPKASEKDRNEIQMTMLGPEVLDSGWAWGQQYLNNSIAVAQATMGKGKVLLYGPEITFRGQPHATFKFLFNGLLYGPSTPTALK